MVPWMSLPPREKLPHVLTEATGLGKDKNGRITKEWWFLHHGRGMLGEPPRTSFLLQFTKARATLSAKACIEDNRVLTLISSEILKIIFIFFQT